MSMYCSVERTHSQEEIQPGRDVQLRGFQICCTGLFKFKSVMCTWHDMSTIFMPGTHTCCTRSEVSFRATGAHRGTPVACQPLTNLTSGVRAAKTRPSARDNNRCTSPSAVRLRRRRRRAPVPCCCRTRAEMMLGAIKRSHQVQSLETARE